MMSRAREDTTQVLVHTSRGDRAAADRLMSLVYDELKRLASLYLRSQRADHILEPTALVHEAYLKLVNQDGVNAKSRTHFLAVAARGMKQILIDHARRCGAAKRGGQWHRVTLSDAVNLTDSGEVDLAQLPDALARLAEWDERGAEVVQLRFFGGLSNAEIAETLDVPVGTVDSDWRHARAWLRRELSGSATS